jgi:hypothetical protein
MKKRGKETTSEYNIFYDEKAVKFFKQYQLSNCKEAYVAFKKESGNQEALQNLFDAHKIPILDYLNNRERYFVSDIVVMFQGEEIDAEKALGQLNSFEDDRGNNKSLTNDEFYSVQTDLEVRYFGEQTILLRKRTKKLPSRALKSIKNLTKGSNSIEYHLKDIK